MFPSLTRRADLQPILQITDSYTIYASSALGGQSAVRLTSGALFTVLAEPLYNRLGIHMAGTLLAALSTAY